VGILLKIQKVCFEDGLRENSQNGPATLAAEVPHLILQHVVENATQHAIAPRASPGRITIAAKRLDNVLQLEVRDTGPGIPATYPSQPSHGVGLSNVRARLERHYGRDFTFELTNGAEEGVA